MVEVRAHAVGVKVLDGRLVGVLRVSVVVHKDDDHNVVTNVTFPLQLQRKGGNERGGAKGMKGEGQRE